ncbi:preprotein translocase subunit YajC [Candidatus Hoaglandella endobia]|uniref:Sec translocon accessory complex subunit YajC n=1 Tax=Candidatus Hoaglandella endobia TaxID=1778263 RepID=A0A143WTI3_9ENTR|nr:preprotein translocase subunit YajC [Candidatus Hoaglandella endobia]CUX97070.1 preprotein translocase subunit YajC [Candidatus Hoaglandella endobia]
MSFFIFEAVADTGATAQSSPYYSLVVMLVFFGLIFYLMILRPQQKRAKIHQELITSLSKGDEILTTSGLVGRVVKVVETGYIVIALNDTNEVIIKRDFITAILPNGTMKRL